MAKKAAKSTSKAPRISPASKPRTKSEIYRVIAESTEVPKKQVVAVFDTISRLIAADLGKSGPKMFTVPGLMKVVAKYKPATPARPGRNPATGETITIKAKPARTIVRIRPLKALKEMV